MENYCRFLSVFLWIMTFLKMILHKKPTMVNLYQISSIVLHQVLCSDQTEKIWSYYVDLWSMICDLSDDNLRVEVHSSLILRSWLPVGGLGNHMVTLNQLISQHRRSRLTGKTFCNWYIVKWCPNTYTLVKTFLGSYCTILWMRQFFWNSGDIRFLRRIKRLDSPREWKRGARDFPYYSHTAGVLVGLVLSSPGQLPSWPPWSPPPSRHLEQVHNFSTSASLHLAQVLCHHGRPS